MLETHSAMILGKNTVREQEEMKAGKHGEFIQKVHFFTSVLSVPKHSCFYLTEKLHRFASVLFIFYLERVKTLHLPGNTVDAKR